MMTLLKYQQLQESCCEDIENNMVPFSHEVIKITLSIKSTLLLTSHQVS